MGHIKEFIGSYSDDHIIWHELFWAWNQSIHQNLVRFMLTYKFWLIFMEIKQKIFFEKKLKFKMADSKNWEFQNL